MGPERHRMAARGMALLGVGALVARFLFHVKGALWLAVFSLAWALLDWILAVRKERSRTG